MRVDGEEVESRKALPKIVSRECYACVSIILRNSVSLTRLRLS